LLLGGGVIILFAALARFDNLLLSEATPLLSVVPVSDVALPLGPVIVAVTLTPESGEL
jgi:hypothetical protein